MTDMAEDDAAEEQLFDLVVDDALDAHISVSEIDEAFKCLKNQKAAGTDGILNEMLKYSLPLLRSILLKLFNQSWDTGRFPEEWMKSIIVPLHKKGSTDNPDNYRAISLISNLCKCFTHIINRRLTKWASENNKIIEEAGYKAGYSTIDQIFVLYSVVQRMLSRNKLYACFVDFQKAYDTVDRKHLWEVLLKQGVSTKMLQCLKGLYEDVKSCVRVSNAEFTDFFECKNGLKQGCLCSPMLFSFFINELGKEMLLKGKHGIQLSPEEVQLFLLLFADDIVLLSDTPVGLQNQIRILEEFAKCYHMKINFGQTK